MEKPFVVFFFCSFKVKWSRSSIKRIGSQSIHNIFPIIHRFFRRSRAANSVVSCMIWPKFELIQDCRHVLVTCKYHKDRIKNNREKGETPFSHYKSMWISQLTLQWPRLYSAFTGSGFCPVPGHVILACKLHVGGKIWKQTFGIFMSYNYSSLCVWKQVFWFYLLHENNSVFFLMTRPTQAYFANVSD